MEMTWLINHSGYVLTRRPSSCKTSSTAPLLDAQQLRFAIDLFHTSQCTELIEDLKTGTPMDWHLMIMQRIERMATTPTVDGSRSKAKPTSLHRPSNRPET
jgi:CMP-N-acetylneuraminic acid synthetase